ncbi:MAG TPA: hypothetical protein VMW49_00875, partial [Candidatus Dormibacteraeota bacterium]|nr:hypothetical protein [Candidatus Dormibacteraeota bacterium]
PAGIYIFKGSTNSININNGSLTCQSNGSSENVYPNGCIFIFEQGAGFAMSGSSAAINCSYGSASVSSVPVSTAPCSFYFVDSTPGSNSAFSVTKGAGGTINPIPYCVPASTAAGCATDNFPVIYSNNVSTSALRPITSLQGAAVVTFDQPGSLQVNGTIYVPHGIYDSSANASQITGQVIADTFRLQTGNSAAPAGVSYNSSTAAPVQEPAFLIE